MDRKHLLTFCRTLTTRKFLLNQFLGKGKHAIDQEAENRILKVSEPPQAISRLRSGDYITLIGVTREFTKCLSNIIIYKK
jgi:hypothetical protein